jgi:hypothetical protein
MDDNREAVHKEMALRGRIGGYARAAKYPAGQLTAPARRGFLRRFEPTDPNLSPQERQRRAEAALKAHMVRLARLSAKARRR